MRVVTYEATVENGLIKLSEEVRLPEHATVYVVVTGVEEGSMFHVGSPRLVQPECAAEFAMEVVEELPDAGLR